MTPFAHISEAPLNQNMQLKGNLVCVTSDIAQIQKQLPRKWDEHSTISTQFMRDLKVKRAWKCGDVRPYHVARAMEVLMKTLVPFLLCV